MMLTTLRSPSVGDARRPLPPFNISLIPKRGGEWLEMDGLCQWRTWGQVVALALPIHRYSYCFTGKFKMGVFSFGMLGVPEKRCLIANGIRNQTKERLNKLWKEQEDLDC